MYENYFQLWIKVEMEVEEEEEKCWLDCKEKSLTREMLSIVNGKRSYFFILKAHKKQKKKNGLSLAF